MAFKGRISARTYEVVVIGGVLAKEGVEVVSEPCGFASLSRSNRISDEQEIDVRCGTRLGW
jgi:hypothetical protein